MAPDEFGALVTRVRQGDPSAVDLLRAPLERQVRRIVRHLLRGGDGAPLSAGAAEWVRRVIDGTQAPPGADREILIQLVGRVLCDAILEELQGGRPAASLPNLGLFYSRDPRGQREGSKD